MTTMAPGSRDLDLAEELLAGIDPPPGKQFLYGLDAYLAVADLRLAGGRTAEAADLVAPLFTAAEDAAWAEGTARTALFLGECSRRCGDPDAAEAFLGQGPRRHDERRASPRWSGKRTRRSPGSGETRPTRPRRRTPAPRPSRRRHPGRRDHRRRPAALLPVRAETLLDQPSVR